MRPMFHAAWIGALCLIGRAFAGSESVGTTSANFLKIPINARPAAMGEAFSALADDESALFYNPAGLGGMPQTGVSATHIEWFQSVHLEHLGGTFRLGEWGGAGLGLTWLQVDEMTRTLHNGAVADPAAQIQSLGAFSPSDLSLVFGYGREWRPGWLLGANLRLLRQNIDSSDGYGVGLDLGAQIQGLVEGLSLGLVLRQVGSKVSLGGEPADMPLSFNAGLLYAAMKERLFLVADTNVALDNQPQSGVGAEAWIKEIFALRVGYRFGYLNSYTLGLGFLIGAMHLDYAFVPYGELGYAHRITASMAFGAPVLRLQAEPALFAPLGFPGLHQALLLAHAPGRKKTTAWKLEIADASGSVRKTLKGDGPVPAQWSWDGRDDEGRLLPDGKVSVRLKGEYPRMKVESAPVWLELDDTPPVLKMDVSPKIIQPENQTGAILVPATFSLGALDPHGVKSWSLRIEDDHGGLFRQYQGLGPPPGEISWDGSDGKGEFVDSGRIYATVFSATDSLGNIRQGEPVNQVVLLREIHLKIGDKVFFDSGKSKLKSGSYKELERIASAIKKNRGDGTKVYIEGHTDNVPIHTSEFSDNLILSKARAQALVDFLVKYLEVDGSTIEAEGFGESRPMADNATPEGRAANRRVVVVIRTKYYR